MKIKLLLVILFTMVGSNHFLISGSDQGTLNTSLNGNGAATLGGSNPDIAISSGFAQAVFTYPLGNLYQNYVLIGIDNETTSIVARINISNMTLDASFGTDGIYTVSPALQGINCIAIDSNNNIIIAGNSPAVVQGNILSIDWSSQDPTIGWALQLSASGTNPIFCAIPTDVKKIGAIAQQKSGRYIMTAFTSSSESQLLAFQDQLTGSNTTLQLDPSFNPLPGAAQGRFTITTGTTVASSSISILSNDTIVTSCIDAGFASIACVAADGSSFYAEFNEGAILKSSITSTNEHSIQSAVDSMNNIVIASSINSGTGLEIARYASSGILDTGFGTNGVCTILSPLLGSAGITLTDLLTSTSNQIILTGFNTAGGHGPIFAARLTSAGILDSTWNSGATSPDVQGVLTYQVDGSIISFHSAIGSGEVYLVGGAIDGTTSLEIPLLMEIIGDSSVSQAVQEYYASPAGTLDFTLDPTGALNLNNETGLVLDQIKMGYMYPDGSILLASNDGVGNTIITKLNALFVLDLTFGLGSGQITIPEVDIITNLSVADALGQYGQIYLTGTTSSPSSMWNAYLDQSGDSYTMLPVIANFTTGSQIIQTYKSNILIAGLSQGSGALALYTANGLGLQPTFGNGTPGIYATNVNNPISAMALDSDYRIYIAQIISGGYIQIQRLLYDGSALDDSFGSNGSVLFPTKYFGYNNSQIRMVIDDENNQLVVAAQDGTSSGNYIRIVRFNMIDGSFSGDVNITIGSAILDLSNVFMDANQEIYVVGSNVSSSPSLGYQSCVARIVSVDATHISLDTTYAVGSGYTGIAFNSIAGLSSAGFTIVAGALNQDRRVYIVGDNGLQVPYLARFFGDNYALQILQAVADPVPGDFDYTYGNSDGIATNYANGAVAANAHQQVKAIAQMPCGTNIMTVVDDTINSWTVQLLADGTNNPAYGFGQGIAIAQLPGDEIVNGMVFDPDQKMIVFGASQTNGGYIKRIFSSGLMDGTFGGYTGSAATTLYPAGTVYNLMTTIHDVAILSNGNIVMVGNVHGVGTMMMLSPTGIPSSTFGGYGMVTSGANITSVSIDASDNIYASVGYLDNNLIKNVRVIKLNAAGSYVTSFGSNGVVDEVIADIDNYENIRLVIDFRDHIIISASGNQSFGTVVTIRLNTDGSINSTFNNGAAYTIDFAQGTAAVVTSLTVLHTGQILISGFQDGGTTTSNNCEFVACLTLYGALDPTFNSQGQTPGLQIFQIDSDLQETRYLLAMSVQNDGQILLAGSQAVAAVSASQDENIPLTMRLDGYLNMTATPQFFGDVPIVESKLDTLFDGTGIAKTAPIDNLSIRSDLVIDSQGRSVVVGTTFDSTFICTRFLTNGNSDLGFGVQGLAQSGIINDTIISAHVAVTGVNDDIIVGGILRRNNLYGFVLVKFSGIDGSQITINFGTNGVAMTTFGFSGLQYGGFLTIDLNNKIVMGGSSSDFQIIIARFDADGVLDSSGFNASSIGVPAGCATTGLIPFLNRGGSVVTDDIGSVYVSGSTLANELLVAKFTSAGVLESTYSSGDGFGVNGIALSSAIEGLVGGSIALDSFANIVVGGCTTNQLFVVAKFLPSGSIDTGFGISGIALSNPFTNSIRFSGNIAIDSNDSIVIGGLLQSSYYPIPMLPFVQSSALIAARWTRFGAIDYSFSSTGYVSTGFVSELTQGGFVAVNAYDNVFLGGLLELSLTSIDGVTESIADTFYSGSFHGTLIVAKFYSGDEIFITDPSLLSASAYKIFLYGNNSDLFRKFLGIELFAQKIQDVVVRQNVVAEIASILDAYVAQYAGQPGLNLTTTLYKIYPNLIQAGIGLESMYPNSQEQIGIFFEYFLFRLQQLTGHPIAVG